MTSLRLALKQSLEESSGGFSPPSDNGNFGSYSNAPPSPSNSHRGVASPTAQITSAADNSNTPQPWKKRGPGRPRKHPVEGGTGKKRGRPRKHPVEEQQPQEQNNHDEEASSSENEFSLDDHEDSHEDEQRDPSEDHKAAKLKKKKIATAAPTDDQAQSEPTDDGQKLKSSITSTNSDQSRKEPKSKEVAVSTMRDKDESRATKAKTVPPPASRVLTWARNLPIKEARQKVAQGLRVKVRFSTRVKRDGKAIRKKKWYGGLVTQVSKAGSKIRIKYDDGTSEVAKFPDKDIVVDATSNDEHQCACDFFLPPEGMSDEEGEAFEHEAEHQDEVLEKSPPTEAHSDVAARLAADASAIPPPPLVVKTSDVFEETEKPKPPPVAVEAETSQEQAASQPETARKEAPPEGATTTTSSKEEEPPKPKRKRGRPPKHRPVPQEQATVPDQKEKELLQSPAPTVASTASTDPLVDTPIQQPQDSSKRIVEPMDIESAVKVSDSLQLDNPEELAAGKLISIRIPKTKGTQEVPPQKQEQPAEETQKEDPSSTKRSSAQAGGSKPEETNAEPRVNADAEADSSNANNGRKTPEPVPVSQKQLEAELRTPISPRTKKGKRKRVVEMSPNPNTRSRSPRPQLDEGKFASAGSAFEKNAHTAVVQENSEDDGKVHTPKGRPGKSEAARSGRRAAKEANERISTKQDDQVTKKKKKRERRREADGEDSDREEAQQQAPWVQCDKCKKWRIIPSEVVGSLPDRWFCENNVWDPKRQSCDAPQQKDKQMVRERKRRKRQRLLEKAAAAENRATTEGQADAGSDGSNERESNTSRSNEEAEEAPAKKPRRASPTEHSDSSNNNEKVEKKSHSKRTRAQSPKPVDTNQNDGALTEMKPRGRGRPRRNIAKEPIPSASGNVQTPDEAENVEWVQCEKCEKWRKLPPEISADELPDVWYCSMNTWNPASASCSAPEDKAEANTTDIFNNGPGADKLSYRNLIFGNGRRFNRPISERTRAAESLFAAVSDDTDAPPTVMYASSSAFISRSKLNQMDQEPEGLSVLELMSRSQLWQELRAVGQNGHYCVFDSLTPDIKESLKDLILHSLGSQTLSGEDVTNIIQNRNWQNVPLGWAAARAYCTVTTIVMTMCELVKEGVLECMKDYANNSDQSGPFVLCYRRNESYSKATLKHLPSTAACCDDNNPGKCTKFAKPWKS